MSAGGRGALGLGLLPDSYLDPVWSPVHRRRHAYGLHRASNAFHPANPTGIVPRAKEAACGNRTAVLRVTVPPDDPDDPDAPHDATELITGRQRCGSNACDYCALRNNTPGLDELHLHSYPAAELHYAEIPIPANATDRRRLREALRQATHRARGKQPDLGHAQVTLGTRQFDGRWQHAVWCLLASHRFPLPGGRDWETLSRRAALRVWREEVLVVGAIAEKQRLHDAWATPPDPPRRKVIRTVGLTADHDGALDVDAEARHMAEAELTRPGDYTWDWMSEEDEDVEAGARYPVAEAERAARLRRYRQEWMADDADHYPTDIVDRTRDDPRTTAGQPAPGGV